MPALLVPIIEWFSATLWPVVLRFLAWSGIAGLAKLIWQWIALFFGEKIMQSLVASVTIFALLEVWAFFLLAFWSFASWGALRDFFNANPFSGVSSLAGSLYLASNFFPFHYFFATAIAYIQWRLTVVHAAIVLNRLVRIMQGM